MKRKNLKSLKLNKKVISNLETTKIVGGTFTTFTVTCTLGEICQATREIIDELTDDGE